MSYAQNTDVPADRSRAEIERTLSRYGARQFMYATSQEPPQAMVGFVVQLDGGDDPRLRQVRFVIPMPDPNDERFALTPGGRRRRSSAQMFAEYEKATRRVWRALLLVIKAKLEAVESGISEFEEEFLAHIVLPDGRTVGEFIRPDVAIAYETGKMPPLALPSGKKK